MSLVMESEDNYIAAIKEIACALVETTIRNVEEYFQTKHGAPLQEAEKYIAQNITWIPCQDFTIELGMKQIEEYISTWEFHESWLHCTDFLNEEEVEFSKLYHYRTRWSIPTRRKPIPRATACVYFTIQISKVKPLSLPVEVFFIFESTRLVHRPGQSRFREKWLKDIIESKLIMMENIIF
ncbi:A-kinase anchor protein 14 isoform X2 [Xenopus tropicalis]|uniref:A-kinase anchor protein 14 isoform X2 n=1 Tax=Xenopus tropicalis TaxID=8364 RepID=A0A6I8Q133_XENTR|nr:A-kinase anchor protein 14 isoform X2 [Xenopus tropicalis]|eukprot:XP_012824631.1 PREDICTED: A-kinase anchor protein 14 isoform X1 [Xenopus tropicalis]